MACGREGFVRLFAFVLAHSEKSDSVELPGSFSSARKKAGEGRKSTLDE